MERNGQAALALGSMVNRLLFVFPSSSFQSLQAETLRLFLDTMTELTCSFLQAVAKEEEVMMFIQLPVLVYSKESQNTKLTTSG